MTKKSKFIRNFLPFSALVIGAFVGLAQFRKANYQYKLNEPILYKEQLNKMGITQDQYQSLTSDSLNDEYKKLMDKIDLENWQSIRGPRPGENSKEIQENLRKNSKKD